MNKKTTRKPEPGTLVVRQIPKLKAWSKKSRYKIAYGGRASGKSWGIGRELLIRGVEKPLRILCTREIQKSVAKSSYQLLLDQIKAMGLEEFYPSNLTTKTEIKGTNGTEFFFMGLKHSIDSILSVEGIDIVWIEEAQPLSATSWNKLKPTIRKTGSEIWVSFNPGETTDFSYQTFIATGLPDSIRVQINYDDNPYLSQEILDDIEHMKATDMELYNHVYKGLPMRHSKAQIFAGKCVVRDFKVPKGVTIYQGLDFGFGPDPCVFVQSYIEKNTLYVFTASFWYRADIDDLPGLIEEVGGPDVKEWRTIADSADGGMVKHLANQGFNIRKVHKPDGSVKFGIRYLRGFDKIVIHQDLLQAQEEARLYRYKTDPTTQEVLPIVQKGFDHFWDALRYSHIKRIYTGKQWED